MEMGAVQQHQKKRLFIKCRVHTGPQTCTSVNILIYEYAFSVPLQGSKQDDEVIDASS
jgi:hypothetical protein